MVAPEGLGELRRLAVADASRDLDHRQVGRLQQRGAVLHPHRGQLVAEGAAGQLREDALELTIRGRDIPRDVVQADASLSVALLDRECGVGEEHDAVRGGRRSQAAAAEPRGSAVTGGRGHRQVGRGVAVAEQLEAPSETAAVQRTSKGGLLADDDQLALAGMQAAIC